MYTILSLLEEGQYKNVENKGGKVALTPLPDCPLPSSTRGHYFEWDSGIIGACTPLADTLPHFPCLAMLSAACTTLFGFVCQASHASLRGGILKLVPTQVQTEEGEKGCKTAHFCSEYRRRGQRVNNELGASLSNCDFFLHS